MGTDYITLMSLIFRKTGMVITLALLLSCSAEIPEDWDKPINVPPVSNLFAAVARWTDPYPAFRVVGNLYGVGTYDLGVFLITTPDGHILINTGIEGSFHSIKQNIESLGFDLGDIKILLTTQAHWDHVAEFARIKHITGAEVWATAGDAPMLIDGGKSDPNHPTDGSRHMFRPVPVDKVIGHGELIELGGSIIKVHEHPGHTPGSVSYSMQITENNYLYDVAIVNMGTINPGVSLIENVTHPSVDRDFATTFERQKSMPVDIWVSVHAGFYQLHKKYQPGNVYDPLTFYDPDGFQNTVAKFEKIYLAKRREEVEGLEYQREHTSHSFPDLGNRAEITHQGSKIPFANQ